MKFILEIWFSHSLTLILCTLTAHSSLPRTSREFFFCVRRSRGRAWVSKTRKEPVRVLSVQKRSLSPRQKPVVKLEIWEKFCVKTGLQMQCWWILDYKQCNKVLAFDKRKTGKSSLREHVKNWSWFWAVWVCLLGGVGGFKIEHMQNSCQWYGFRLL